MEVVKKEKKIPVVEVFGPTIEGEGSVIGKQTMFIRFGLCDYKCTKCDSMHAVDPTLVKNLAAWMTEEEIASDLLAMMEARGASHIENITFSGGNPAIHNLSKLTAILQSVGKKVIVETQGTKHPEWLARVNHIVCSPKGPGMGEKFDPQVFREFVYDTFFTGVPYSIKIVVFSAQDLEFAVGIAGLLEQMWTAYKPVNIQHWSNNFYLSLGNPQPPKFSMIPDPEDGKASIGQEDTDKKALVGELLSRYNNLSDEIMKDHRLGFARFLPQLHVLVWGNETGK